MKIKTMSLFFLITHHNDIELDLLQFVDGKLCELVSVPKKLTKILEMTGSVIGLCCFTDLHIAKTRRDELQNGYEKEIMIFSLLIKTETDVII